MAKKVYQGPKWIKTANKPIKQASLIIMIVLRLWLLHTNQVDSHQRGHKTIYPTEIIQIISKEVFKIESVPLIRPPWTSQSSGFADSQLLTGFEVEKDMENAEAF